MDSPIVEQQEESAEGENQTCEKVEKFVAFIIGDNGDIVINVSGLSDEQAVLLSMKGNAKLKRVYEASL